MSESSDATGRDATRPESDPVGPNSGSSSSNPAGRPAPPGISPARLDSSLAAIRSAAERIAPHILRTPLIPSGALSDQTGRDVHLKLEILQRTGAFKVRGALNKILGLSSEERGRGVIAASAGNHAQGVGLASKLTETPAVIVMPEATPVIKVERTRAFGAEIVLHGNNYEGAYERALELCSERQLTMVHPFDDFDVIHGQGTIGLELDEQLPREADAVVVPIGGGGLIAGIALALAALRPGLRVIGVQAEGAAPMARSFAAGRAIEVEHPQTLADGIQVGRAGSNTWPLVRDLVHDVVTVSDQEIAAAIATGIESCKVVLEGAGAAGLAAVLNGRVDAAAPCVVLCGGNIDLNLMARVIERGLSDRGRYRALRLRTRDVPGTLLRITLVLGDHQANILDIAHHRQGWKVPVGFVEVEILAEVRSAAVGDELAAGLKRAGFELFD